MYLAGSSYDVDMISNFMQQNFPSTFLKVRKRKKKHVIGIFFIKHISNTFI